MTYPEFEARWKPAGGAERANYGLFLQDLCDLIGVQRPDPTTNNPNQYTNRLLAKIGEAASVDFKLTTHTARHTFGTFFIELDGDVVTLKDYMGHSKIETTMKYVHISERRKKEKINVFDKLLEKRTGPQKVA